MNELATILAMSLGVLIGILATKAWESIKDYIEDIPRGTK